MEAREIVGWNLRRLRVERGFSIEELADRAEVDPSYVARIERASVNSSIGVLGKLALALGIRTFELLIEPLAGAQPPKPLKSGRRKEK